MMRLARFLLLLATLAGLIHVFAILATPYFAGQKVWNRIVSVVPERVMFPLENHTISLAILGQADPAMGYALCHFNLRDGPVQLTANAPTNFWNVAIFDREARMLYSLHNGASQSGQLELEIRTPRATDDANGADETGDSGDVALEPADQTKSDGIPQPTTKPLSTEAEPVAETPKEDVDEDEAVVAELNLADGFLVVKMLAHSKHYRPIVSETLQNAQCR